MNRTYKAWIVVGEFKAGAPFPLWKSLGEFLPHFTSKSKALRFLKDRDIPLGGAMNLRIVECVVSCDPKGEKP